MCHLSLFHILCYFYITSFLRFSNKKQSGFIFWLFAISAINRVLIIISNFYKFILIIYICISQLIKKHTNIIKTVASSIAAPFLCSLYALCIKPIILYTMIIAALDITIIFVPINIVNINADNPLN